MQRLYIGAGSVLATCSLKWHPETNISAICLLESSSAGPGKSERLRKTSLEGWKLLLSALLTSRRRAGVKAGGSVALPFTGQHGFLTGWRARRPSFSQIRQRHTLVVGSRVAPGPLTLLCCCFSPVCAPVFACLTGLSGTCYETRRENWRSTSPCHASFTSRQIFATRHCLSAILVL